MTDFSTITACGECCTGCAKKIEGSCPGCIVADANVIEHLTKLRDECLSSHRKSKILVLAGSPRKEGNTEKLVEAFVKGAAGNHAVEVISVTDHKVNPCVGCNSCFTREGHECFQKDDMDEIYAKLKEADVLIVASPVYFYGISAQLKAVIDRLHTPMRNEFRVKKLGLILVGAAQLPELFDSILTQYDLILNFFHLAEAGKVLVRGAREKGDVTEEDLEKAFLLGQSIN
ncbi:MAG: flavodoxin family protein [Lachnospiraceae bacterium]|nr:flavodoxin family protein [Lachnospiraceae bacterium]